MRGNLPSVSPPLGSVPVDGRCTSAGENARSPLGTWHVLLLVHLPALRRASQPRKQAPYRARQLRHTALKVSAGGESCSSGPLAVSSGASWVDASAHPPSLSCTLDRTAQSNSEIGGAPGSAAACMLCGPRVVRLLVANSLFSEIVESCAAWRLLSPFSAGALEGLSGTSSLTRRISKHGFLTVPVIHF